MPLVYMYWDNPETAKSRYDMDHTFCRPKSVLPSVWLEAGLEIQLYTYGFTRAGVTLQLGEFRLKCCYSLPFCSIHK